MLFKFAPTELTRGARTIPELVKELFVERTQYDGPERRQAERHRVVVPIALVPVDDELNPVDEGFRGITRDLSATGVSFLHLRDVGAAHLIAQFVASKVGVVKVQLEVVRTEFLDPLYVTAAQFVTPSKRTSRKHAAKHG
jgi:hypothetical protein